MNLKNSETLKNLARGFAGETMAGLKYQMIVDACITQGYQSLADEIKVIAKNEVNHAKTFFNLIIDNGCATENIDISAGFPFKGKSLLDMLKFSLELEKTEADEIYPTFSKIAMHEGFTDIANTFDMVSEVEKAHVLKFKYFYESIKNGTLYKTKKPATWQCANCGHIETGLTPWNVCPLCGSTQGYVKIQLP